MSCVSPGLCASISPSICAFASLRIRQSLCPPVCASVSPAARVSENPCLSLPSHSARTASDLRLLRQNRNCDGEDQNQQRKSELHFAQFDFQFYFQLDFGTLELDFGTLEL